MSNQFRAEPGRPSAEVSRNSSALPAGSDSVPSRAPAGDLRRELVYDLRMGGECSDRFYADLAAFSARVVAEVESRASGMLDGYSRYVTDILLESPRSRAEYALELLAAGMVLRLYGDVAARTPGWVVDVARKLFVLRRRRSWIKPMADSLRA